MNEKIEAIAKELVADLKSRGIETHYKSLSEKEKEIFLLSQYLKKIKDEVNFEFGKLSHKEAITAMENELDFKKISLPNVSSRYDKFSLMYREDKELLCSISGTKSDMTISCVSPYLDKAVKFNHFGTFISSLTTGDLLTSLETNSKGKVSFTELPILSSDEHSWLDEVNFASYCGLTYEEEERYNNIGIIHSIDSKETEEMEIKYKSAMQFRKLTREKLIEERVAVLPETFKEFISYENTTQKTFK